MAKYRLEITDFLGGLAPSQYYGGKNQSDPTNTAGWTAFSDGEENILQRGMGNATLTNASYCGGEMYAMCGTNRNAESSVFGISADSAGTGAVLHKINSITNTLNNASPWPHALPAISTFGGLGAELYDGYFYYSYGKYLGRYDMSLTFNDSFNISLTGTAYGSQIEHPMCQGNGKLFIGNAQAGGGACITQVAGDVVTLVALDLKKTDKIIKSLAFSGNYLYVATSGNAAGTDGAGDCSLLAWDTVSGSWQNEYVFPENDFTAIKSMNGRMFCWGPRGFYEFSGGRFVPIHPASNTTHHYGVDISPRGILYFSDSTGNVWSYGSSSNKIPDAIQKPVNGLGSGSGRSLKFASRTRMYYSKLGAIGVATSGSSATAFPSAGSWRTPVFNLGRRVHVIKVYIVGQNLPAGTSFTATLYDETGTNVGCGTYNTTGQNIFQFTPNGFYGESFQMGISHSDGATPKFRKIVVEYEYDKE